MKILIASFAIFLTVPAFAEEKKFLEDIRLDETKQTEKQREVRTVYDEGFTMIGEDDTLKIGAWMQNDVRIFPEGHPGVTQFLVRRARLDVRGSLEKIFSVQLMGEFEGDGGTNAANLKQGFLEYNQFPAFRVRVGQFKEPYGLENLYSDPWLDFLERPIAENFIRPEQDVGLMFFGKLFGKRLEYGLGIFNGSATNIAENNDDKDFAGRIVITPFLASESKWVKHLSIGGSVTYGKQNSTLDGTGPTTQAGTRFIAFVNPTTGNDVRLNDFRTRAGGDLEWLIDSFSFKSEYVFTHFTGITFGGARRSFDLHGHSHQVTYLLTGEDKTNQRSILPEKPFNPKEENWGALELAGRFEMVHSDQGLINAGFATGTDDLWSVTGGLNWYLNRHIRLMANYIYTKFDDSIANANGNNEHTGLFRFQFNL